MSFECARPRPAVRRGRVARIVQVLAGLVAFTLVPSVSVFAETGLPGTVSGRVFDGESGAPIENATVILVFSDPGDGSDQRQEVATTGPDGDYEFDAIPAGTYSLSFVKSGYRTSSVTDFQVEAGRDNVADFPMPPAPIAPSGEVLELDAFVVEASLVGDMMQGLEMRLESDQLLNILSAEDLSKFAAGDVAEALSRVAGVNVQEGQFAIIRGLEDRYSSTLFNGAPVPSPDPDRQSVQLDLFPSDVVTNLVVAKTFAAESPSNSSSGSIDILTQNYPDELTLKVSLGAGFNEEARDRFLKYNSGSTVGTEEDWEDVVDTDYVGSLGGHFSLFGKDIRFKAVANHEVDHRSRDGWQEGREPQIRGQVQRPVGPPLVFSSGSLAFGELPLSDGKFDQIRSTREEQLTTYLGFGFDLDDEEKHRIDASIFYTDKKEETVEMRENGFFPGYDYSELITATEDEDDLFGPIQNLDLVATPGSALAGAESSLRVEVDDSPDRGSLWFSSFGRSNSFERKRDLSVYQLNGEHDFDLMEGLEVTWAANYATTHQDETSLGMRFFYEPCGWSGQYDCPAGVPRGPVPTQFPVRVSDLGVGSYFASGAQGGIVFSETDIKENQWFGRLDFDQDIAAHEHVDLDLKGGVWWEKSRRNVDAFFVDGVTVNGFSQWALDSPTLPQLGATLFDRLDPLSANRQSTTRASREITAGYASLKATILEDIDLLAGLRFEDIYIDSENDPFTGEEQFTRPVTFPTAYLFFDRLDNPDPALGSEVAPNFDPTGVFYNDQILGINTPINPSTGFVDLLTRAQIQEFVNGEIDEFKVLPFAGIAYRPIENVTLRVSFSQTVARPSFREMGYYVTVDPGTDDRVIGNPQLELSDVENYDFRAEWADGDSGDLFAFSAFYKTIDDPIESIVVRNPLDFDGQSSALFRTFFNNQDVARLWGIEVEARKDFGFVRELAGDFPGSSLFEHLSIGGNFTYIEAEVDRSEAEIARADAFFVLRPGDTASYTGLEKTRRLFGQPEWIGNADVSFNHPDWGTTATLAIFAISDVLDAAGSSSLGPDGVPFSGVLDRYRDSFYQLDLVASQRIWGGLSAKVSVKNLTDTTRRLIYDKEQTKSKVVERSWKQGRTYSFSLTYEYEF